MEKIWLRKYPLGVPAEINPDSYASIVQIFEEACSRFANKTAYISMGRRMSYASLDAQSRRFAAWLQSVGVERGTRVALMMPNLLQYPVCLFGVLRAGCAVVNCNPLYTAPELEHQLKDSGAEVIVIVENFAHTLQKIVGQTAIRHVVTTSVGELLGLIKGAAVNYAVRHIKKLVPNWSLPGSVSLGRALAIGGRRGFRAVTLDHSDLAFLQYTGGTTGISKGAMLTHRNIVSNVLQADAWISPLTHEGEELIVTALPLYHIFALTANCLTFLRLGAANLLIANPRDIPGFIGELSRHRFTAITGVNTLFNAMLANPDFAKLDFSSLRLALGGGMAVQEAVAQKWLQVTGTPLAQAYGLTETSPAVCIFPFIEHMFFNGSIGLPISSTELSIRDSDAHEVPPGQPGEICVRGPQVMAGYFKRPAETANVFCPDGFLKTGDIGYVDQEGYVFLIDRKKDMILVSGFNVYPNEVEAAVALHPGVQDVACIGVADEHSGEAVKIFVVRGDPYLTAEMLIAHCRSQLTGYKVPHHVEFRDDLPRSNVGKILRRALKEHA
jgi:long-chain acyl-CoA synthetase